MATISDQAIAKVKAEAPSSFTVGVTANALAKRADAAVTYDRRWTNGWGLTAYAKAWWHDEAVVPRDKHGAVIGIEAKKQF